MKPHGKLDKMTPVAKPAMPHNTAGHVHTCTDLSPGSTYLWGLEPALQGDPHCQEDGPCPTLCTRCRVSICHAMPHKPYIATVYGPVLQTCPALAFP